MASKTGGGERFPKSGDLVVLQQIAESDSPDRVSAAKVILAYTLGAPRLEFRVERTHAVSVENVLRQIAEERRWEITGAVNVKILRSESFLCRVGAPVLKYSCPATSGQKGERE